MTNKFQKEKKKYLNSKTNHRGTHTLLITLHEDQPFLNMKIFK